VKFKESVNMLAYFLLYYNFRLCRQGPKM